eukprot:scaffold60256_cov55-Attheya_sp.AAC.3
MMMMRCPVISCVIVCLVISVQTGSFQVHGFSTSHFVEGNVGRASWTVVSAMKNDEQPTPTQKMMFLPTRRSCFEQVAFAATIMGVVIGIPGESWAEFAPGGTLVDRAVGVTVGNAEASQSRKSDNSNVVFDKDYYFKFGAAPVWIEPDSTEFPKTMPFTLSQQRYDSLKKYGDRVKAGLQQVQNLKHAGVDVDHTIADPSKQDVYALRPMGLMANGFLASENTGATNELFLSRWYINEIYLGIQDMMAAGDNKEQAKQAYESTKKATNSYLSMINRVITPKVGDKFEYIS